VAGLDSESLPAKGECFERRSPFAGRAKAYLEYDLMHRSAANMESAPCTFCEIVAGRLPSQIHYSDDEIVVFDNQLRWLPVMMLIVPRQHLTQSELWSSGSLMSRMGDMAVRLGDQHCPAGFRVLSNFGPDALQTQPHGHLHVIGGADLGLYIRRPGR
jgi:histidine triad (HIT) family protein